VTRLNNAQVDKVLFHQTRRRAYFGVFLQRFNAFGRGADKLLGEFNAAVMIIE